jgi:hypothetical protein
MTEPLSMLLAPLAFYVAFMVTLIILSRGSGIERLKNIVAIFLAAPVSLKTWGLFLSAPAVLLLVNSMLMKIGNDALWPHSDAVALARIAYYNNATIGCLVLMSIILGAFGAVAFKGQLPGGSSFEMKQDGMTGTTTASGTGPAPVPPVPPVSA